MMKGDIELIYRVMVVATEVLAGGVDRAKRERVPQFQRMTASARATLCAVCRNWLYLAGRYTLEPPPLE